MESIQIKSGDSSVVSLNQAMTTKAIKATGIPVGEGQLPIDIYENEESILIVTPIAGVDLEQTEIIITNDVLTIRGCRESDVERFGFSKKRNAYAEECFWGNFSRSVILPTNVDTHLIEATQEDHVLYVKVPKRRNIKMRIVKIKS